MSDGDKEGRLLIVEDDERIRTMIRKVFSDRFEVSEARNGQEGLEKALDVRPDVIITDQRMPELSGIELLSKLKDELPDAVRVLVTGFADYGPAVDAVNAAEVHRYIEKPFHTVDLKTVVLALHRGAKLERQRRDLTVQLQESVVELERANRQLSSEEIKLKELVDRRTADLRGANDELRRLNEQLELLAVRDSLTGLFNHRALMEHLELELARASRYKRDFALLFIDVDDFKSINDRFGHAVGDQVLRTLAEMLGGGPQALRRSDVAARYGGEEFCVLLPETGAEGAGVKAERIRRSVAAHGWARVAPVGSVTVSIGVAAYPSNGSTVAEVLKAADQAMYASKKSGKNRVTLAETE